MGKSGLVVILLAAAAVAAAAEPQDLSKLKAGTHDLSFDVDGKNRTYRLHLPRNFEAGKAVPLVLALHGMGSTGVQTERLTGFTELADKHGFAVAYPDGLNRIWRYGERGGGGDFGFLLGLVDRLAEAGIVAGTRVYATGISNGAYMSNALAGLHADRFAAIAPVAGTMLAIQADRLRPSRAVPVICFHGTEDSVVRYDGSDRFTGRKMSLGAEELAAWWAERNGCAREPAVERLPDKAPDDGTRVERRVYGKGRDGTEVAFYRVEGGGHTWPGGSERQERLLGTVSRDISASELIWEFFARFRLP
jgi:polyhydroxybutyrate depolymerase